MYIRSSYLYSRPHVCSNEYEIKYILAYSIRIHDVWCGARSPYIQNGLYVIKNRVTRVTYDVNKQ